jgi:hypothetical protein
MPVAQRTEIQRLLPGITRWRRSGTSKMGGGGSHRLIVVGRGEPANGCTQINPANERRDKESDCAQFAACVSA